MALKKREGPRSGPSLQNVTATPVRKKAKLVQPTGEISELETGSNESVPIDVTYDGIFTVSQSTTNTGGFHHTIHLHSVGQFSLIKTTVLDSGQYLGLQAILLRPTEPIPFSKLPYELRTRVYRAYFANESGKGGPIMLDGKRSDSKDAYAKTFADGSKYRVALLAVNKDISLEAHPVLYGQAFKFANSSVLVDFLVAIPASSRRLLCDIEIQVLLKTNSRHAWNFLAEAPELRRVHIEAGIANESNTTKAARAFLSEAYKLLEVMGRFKNNRAAGVDMLSFGPRALTYSTGARPRTPTPWTPAMLEEFRGYLKSKMA